MIALGPPDSLAAGEAVDPSEARAFLRASLGRPRRRATAMVIPAPVGTPLALLDRTRRGDAFHVHDERRSFTALGATRSAQLEGPARFADASRRYETGRDELELVVHERRGEQLPAWFFGFAFADGRARDPWAPLGDGRLVLPRWLHRVEQGTASLTLTIDRDEPAGADLALAELDAIWDALAEPPSSPTARPASARHVDEARWSSSIDDVRARIAAQAVEKVVVARRSTVLAERDIDPVRVLRRLERPGATLFCVRRRGVAFVGATPERLFRKRARCVSTEAVAGTVSLDRDPSGRRLFASTKDLHEHQLVVDGIVSAMAGLRADVAVGARTLRTIGALAHLSTPIEAHLTSETSPFEILDALHPTPAVGGAPRAAALDWIRRNEPDRGWYAGPLGWIDAHGDAEAHVALRSALIVGARAYAYAGCGVVAGSDPHAEYVETSLKLEPMLAALGVGP